jgi:hypothetical protein
LSKEGFIADLPGHSNGSIITGWYGKRYNLDKLFEIIQQVDYGKSIEKANNNLTLVKTREIKWPYLIYSQNDKK